MGLDFERVVLIGFNILLGQGCGSTYDRRGAWVTGTGQVNGFHP
jgi:hypothetical protein